MLNGKTAVITGSTSGIGLGIARRLAQEKANIVVNGFGDPEKIKDLCDQMVADFGIKVHYINADISHPEEIYALVKEVQRVFGGVDILVNNAGIQYVCPIEDYPADKWDAIIAINLSAAFHMIKAVFPIMRERSGGRIINIASTHGLVGSPFKSAYVAAKHGLIGLTKVTALEGAPHNITCNAICPGYTWTPLVESQIRDTAKARGIPEENVIKDVMLAEQPIKEFVTIDQIAEIAAFLCSKHLNNMTGTSLTIDGGWTAH